MSNVMKNSTTTHWNIYSFIQAVQIREQQTLVSYMLFAIIETMHQTHKLTCLRTTCKILGLDHGTLTHQPHDDKYIL